MGELLGIHGEVDEVISLARCSMSISIIIAIKRITIRMYVYSPNEMPHHI